MSQKLTSLIFQLALIALSSMSPLTQAEVEPEPSLQFKITDLEQAENIAATSNLDTVTSSLRAMRAAEDAYKKEQSPRNEVEVKTAYGKLLLAMSAPEADLIQPVYSNGQPSTYALRPQASSAARAAAGRPVGDATATSAVKNAAAPRAVDVPPEVKKLFASAKQSIMDYVKLPPTNKPAARGTSARQAENDSMNAMEKARAEQSSAAGNFRCIVGGFFLENSKKCTPVGRLSRMYPKIKNETVQLADGTKARIADLSCVGKATKKQRYRALSNTQLCQPMAFGLHQNGEQFCVPFGPNSAQDCLRLSKSDPKAQEWAKAFRDKFKDEASAFNKKRSVICEGIEFENDQVKLDRTKRDQWSDIRRTCKAMAGVDQPGDTAPDKPGAPIPPERPPEYTPPKHNNDAGGTPTSA